MKERELGTMQVANERIRIVEPEITPDSSHEARVPFIEKPLTPIMIETQGTLICAEWYARVEDGKDVAWATIVEYLKGDDCVVFYSSVSPSHRRLGLGRLMIRFATDQAIRYRKRTILAEVESTNEVALKILDEEDFEVQPEQHPGYTLLRKELKWT